MGKKSIFIDNISARKQQIELYMINIENYKRAIERAKMDPELSDFTEKLTELLRTENLECKKEKIMLAVLEEQLMEMGE